MIIQVSGLPGFFKRVNGVWTQQGPKIVPVDNNGPSYFGNSVSISADGNTAVVGGSRDNNFNGAFWVLKCINGVWGFQGAKIIGDNLPQWAYLGYSVSISGDGNTILAGAPSAVVIPLAGYVYLYSQTEHGFSKDPVS